MFGDCVRRLLRDAHHQEAELRGGRDVDMVVAGRTQSGEPHASSAQGLERRPIERRSLTNEQATSKPAATAAVCRVSRGSRTVSSKPNR